jgi:hypothetical protein
MSPKQAKQQEFEESQDFPEPEESAVEIEVLDDTPEEDRQMARPAADRVDPDSEEFEEEIKNYSDAAQKRIKALKYEFHEERRAKEGALRQSEEAVRYAEHVASDNAALRDGLESSNAVLIEQYGARSDAELDAARTEFKEAYEGGETDALLGAQEKLSRLHAERVKALSDAERFERSRRQQPVGQTQQVGQPQSQSGQTPAPDAKAMEWLRDNPWFHASGYEDMTGYAVGLHQKLVMEGLNPQVHHDEYYRKIDEGLQTVFPEYSFSSGQEGGNGADSAPAVTSGRKPPPVGGPSRGGKPPRKVQLTTTQVALAKRLGLTNKQYAAQVAKEELTNG